MRHHLKHYIRRHEPRGAAHLHLKSGIGAISAMVLVGLLAVYTGLPMLIAPFGATAVLLFGQPKSPLSQPANVIGGYLLAALIGGLAAHFFPGLWLAGAVAVGLTIGLMLFLRVTHPPAGAVPLVAIASHFDVPVLIEVVMIGSILLVAVAVLHHYIPPRQQYPLRAD
ncbi:HPP family protein [Pararhizobium sp.]|uniref:HPP family protein n=1 Tax=Pararhizobium sp. TaxID=1977563 RepID=UPI002726F3B3|nr:HPP family protein [Pararhizobium sp.]MDO9417662.1 HPP family protein [Pararhizobium sp.]